MGMYDTINGEQVKCFPWVSYYKNEINYHGGDLKYYNTGDEVPYKKPHYNYGKNFVILDLNRYFGDVDYVDYDYIIHVIVDGKVKDTFENELSDIDWSINNCVVDYNGELLNIKNRKELLGYIKAQRECWTKYDKVNSHWNELFDEIMPYYNGFGLLADGSSEKEYRLQKIREINKLMSEEKEKILPKIHALNKSISKWFIDKAEISDLISLGNYIEAYRTELARKRTEEVELCIETIREKLSSDDTLYDRYVEWQSSDEFIKEFKE